MENAFPTPYPGLNSVVKDLVDRVQVVLRDNFVGAYGDFDPHSDVDFLIVLEREFSP